MTKGILCIIDFSAQTKEVLRFSAELARSLNSRLIILYVYRFLEPIEGEATEIKQKLEDEAYKNFLKFEKDTLLNQGVEYEFKAEVGFVADRAKYYTKKNRASLLVVGKRVNSQSQSLQELIEESQLPVVVVP